MSSELKEESSNDHDQKTLKVTKSDEINSFGTDLSSEDNKEREYEMVDVTFHHFACLIVQSSAFNWLIICTIFLNALAIALETLALGNTAAFFLVAADNVFLGIYLLEFAIKLYAERVMYWRNYYNLFDFAILMISVLYEILMALEFGSTGLTVLKVIRALRTLRTLRSISFIRGLQVLVSALVQTFKSSVFYLLLLLLVLMFLFAIMGFYFFGYEEDGDKKNWGSFGQSMLSLFTFVTADGWTDLQEDLSSHGYTGSELFVMIFLFMGHFIFTNLFIGVIIMNIHDATQEFENQQRAEKEVFIQEKKDAMIAHQHEDVMQMMEKQRENNFCDFREMTKEFEKTLRHNDFTYTTDLCTTIPWMETLIPCLQHLETSRHRSQMLQFELAEVLAQIKEIQLEESEYRKKTETM